MDRKTLLDALRNTSFDRHRCWGCGHEHNCSTQGCAVNRAAAELIEEQAARIAELEPPDNDPLTLEELRGMNGEPVYDWKRYEWFVISDVTDDAVVMTDYTEFDIDEDSPNSAVGRFYRRKPESADV